MDNGSKGGQTITLVYSEVMIDQSVGPGMSPDRETKTPKSKSWLKAHQTVLIIVSAVIVVLGGGAAAYFLMQPKLPTTAAKHTPPPSKSPAPTPTPVTKLSPLTGLPLAPALADQPIAGVIIENHPDARPQSGLSQAGVVYEANAEGGITRFEAFFLDSYPAVMGPVRSLRTYFLTWGLEFNAPVAHAGGNSDALGLIVPKHMKDINALSFASDGFYRSTDRVAPHNLYITNAKLLAVMKRLGYTGVSDFAPSPRKADAPNANAPHPHIHIDFSYARSMAGAPHIDRNTGKQIHVKNVVIEMMPTSYGTTNIGEQTVIMGTTGKGQGWVCRDGDCVAVTWQKDSDNARTKLIGPDGKDTPLDAGNTWYAIVPVGKNVSF
jgi:hypothetical protein